MNDCLPPQRLPHHRPALDNARAQLRQAQTDHDLTDLLVVIERTGRYHRVVQRAWTVASLEVRIVHQFATKQLRQVANPGDKTDAHDLFARHSAARNGFALAEPQGDELWTEFLRPVRYRRGLIHKTSKLRCQIRNHLDVYLPGFADCFNDFWRINCTWPIARHFLAPQAIRDRGDPGLEAFRRPQRVRIDLRDFAAWKYRHRDRLGRPGSDLNSFAGQARAVVGQEGQCDGFRALPARSASHRKRRAADLPRRLRSRSRQPALQYEAASKNSFG